MLGARGSGLGAAADPSPHLGSDYHGLKATSPDDVDALDIARREPGRAMKVLVGGWRAEPVTESALPLEGLLRYFVVEYRQCCKHFVFAKHYSTLQRFVVNEQGEGSRPQVTAEAFDTPQTMLSALRSRSVQRFSLLG